MIGDHSICKNKKKDKTVIGFILFGTIMYYHLFADLSL
jgi:hypothetical protein